MNNLTRHGEKQIERLAMHTGLLVVLLQRGAPLSLIQGQCFSLREMLKEIINLDDEAIDAYVQVDKLLPDDVASALTDNVQAPSDLSSLDDTEPQP